MTLKEGAIFIADAHYLPSRDELTGFLELLLERADKPPQLFLMGDIFDFLSPYVPYSVEKNQKPINLINTLSLEVETVIFEGNHDFNLLSLFPNAIVIPRRNQPFIVEQNGVSISLSHGDIDQGVLYECYRNLVESKIVLKPLVLIDALLNNLIIKKIYNYLENKTPCRDFEHFGDKASQIVQKSVADVVIEGHYHQGVILNIDSKTYVGLPSLVCKKSFFVVEFKENALFFTRKNTKEF